MIRIRLINNGRVVKQITSRVHEGVVLEQINKYKDPFDTVQIVEGDLSEGAKEMLHHVARKIIPAAMAAGIAMSGAGAANAQGGANPNYPGLNHSVGQHMADIFSPNYKEAMRQREYNRSTERQVWNAEQNEIRKQRVNAARDASGGGQQHVIYDQSRLSQDGKSYIIYGIDNKVRRIPVVGTEYMVGDSQRLPHYITSGGAVLYVRHPHTVTESIKESSENKDKHDKGYSDASNGIAKNPYNPGSPAAAAYDAGQAAYKRHFNEGYTVTRGIDKERYTERAGLEGPFSTKSGKVVYYDKAEGKYYDPDTDFYIGHEDYAKMDEAAPAIVRGAAALALGGVTAAGTIPLMGIFGPVLGFGVGAVATYNAAKMGMNSADAVWDWAVKKFGGSDNAEHFAMTHINAALKGEPSFEYNGKTFDVKATPQQAKAAGMEIHKVAEDATVGTIPASGTVGTSGGMSQRTQFAPTGKTTNAKFNKSGQIELDTEQEDDGSVNLDAAAVKQLQQAGVKMNENNDGPVASAIAGRIMRQRMDLLSKYGPELVTQAIDQIADYVGDVEEIGSSDVSGWVKHVEQMLRNNPPEAFNEAVNEGTDTLEGILSKYSADYAKFKSGGDIDENQDFFDALYEYYFDEMPYGTKKARDGDPYEWITQRLDQEGGVAPVAEADDDSTADQNIIMQIRKVSDYQKPTKIKLADGTASVIAPNIAKQLLAKFDKMKPDSKTLLQDTLNTEQGFAEILDYFGSGVHEQAAARAGNIMQSAMIEAGFGRDAYQRDYDSSVSGMGKRGSYAYSQDGGANDESNELDPTDWYVVQDGKMMRVSVYPNQVNQARAKGYSPSRELAKVKAQQGVAEASLTQMRDYFNQTNNNTISVDNQYGAPERKKPANVPSEIQMLINKMYRVGKITPQEFDILKRFQIKTGINVGLKIKEAGNAYAVGMSQAMKNSGDTPPLKKSTINKAHEIARAVEKDK